MRPVIIREESGKPEQLQMFLDPPPLPLPNPRLPFELLIIHIVHGQPSAK